MKKLNEVIAYSVLVEATACLLAAGIIMLRVF
jgi:hypothetical protein